MANVPVPTTPLAAARVVAPGSGHAQGGAPVPMWLLAQYLLFQVHLFSFAKHISKFTQYFRKKKVTGSTQSFHGSCENPAEFCSCSALVAVMVLAQGPTLSISDQQLPLLTVKARVCLLFDSCADFTGIH